MYVYICDYNKNNPVIVRQCGSIMQKLSRTLFYHFIGVLYALIFGQVTNIITQLQKSSNEFTEQMSSIKNFNTIYKMPPKVAKRLEDYFIATWAVTKGTDEEEVNNIKSCTQAFY